MEVIFAGNQGRQADMPRLGIDEGNGREGREYLTALRRDRSVLGET